MATPTIPNGEEYFFPIIYEGNGGGQRVGKFIPFTDSGTINNSCMFNSPDSPVLSRTPSGTGTSKKTFTISAWVKRSRLINSASFHSQNIFGVNHGSNSRYNIFGLFNNGSGNPTQVRLFLGKYTTGSSTTGYDWITNRTLEDTSKWYHLMAVVDTTDDTAGDRVKLYIDGERVTSFASYSNPNQNDEFYFGSEHDYYISTYNGSNGHWDGYMAEINFVDGQALLPASFGQTDTSTGRWIPSVVKPYPTTTTTFTVTVSNPGSGNKYYIDSSQQATVTLIEGATYRFDQSDSSNSGHPLRFSTTSDGTHGGGTEFTSGVTTVGTPGSSGAYTEITVPTSTATLYYYCTNHSGMGGTANTQDQYGTNGFRLQFGTSSAMGTDTAKSNDFSLTNIDATNQTTDSPTQNFATFDPNDDTGTMPLSEGNREVTQSGSSSGAIRGTLAPSSGKYYFEFTAISVAGSDGYGGVGIQLKNEPVDAATSIGTIGANTYIYRDDGRMIHDEDDTSGFTNWGSGAIIGVALDLDNGKLYFSYSSGAGTDGVFENSGDPVAGTGAVYTLPSNQRYAPYLVFKGNSGQNYSLNTGQTSFNTTPPTGFSALQQDNLPETAKGISGLSWMKDRDSGSLNHALYDSSRGVNKLLYPNTTSDELSVTSGVSKFLKGGYAVGDAATSNNAGDSFVAWNWVANSGTTESISAGGGIDIASTVQKNTTAGFSIVQYTGNATAGATVGHGLSQAPEFIVTKRLDGIQSWHGYHSSQGATKYFILNSNVAFGTSTLTWNNAAPNATTFTLGSGNTNNNTGEFVAYCWHGVEGFSKFGSYTGGGGTDGTFVYTGFRPAFVLMKNTSSGNWYLKDTTRDTFNPCEKTLMPNLTNVEAAQTYIDILSNGFKQRINNDASNLTGSTYIYIAFAEHPFVGDGTNPVTAR